MSRQYSRDGLHLTESFESCALVAYWDKFAQIWTIGWGHTRGVNEGDSCTQERADAWLLEDVQEAVAAVNRLVTAFVTQPEFDAMVDFTFNAGQGNFASSTLLKDVNAGNFVAASREFLRWDQAGGAHIAGLARRRHAESDLFQNGIDA